MTALGVCLLAGTGGTTMAGPRDSATLTNLNSDAQPNAGTGTIPGTSGYTAKFVRVQGTLTKLLSSSFAREAVVQISNTAGEAPTPLVLSELGSYGPSITVDRFLRLPAGMTSGPLWGVTTLETYDDGAGADARWDTLTITLNDGAPTNVVDLGQLSAGTIHKTGVLSPGETVWVRFSINLPVQFAAGRGLSIDTQGTLLTGGSNDTVIGLYNEDGVRVGYNDDSAGLGLLSRLGYGLSGVDGDLPAGTYYLGLRGIGGSSEVGWDFASPANTRHGPFSINITSNFGGPVFCPGDFNKSSSVEVQDIFDFLSAWFGGCP